MNKWWKNPVLQGPENDYGDYDYLIEELPDDYARWEHSRYACKCDSCGKERHLLFRSVHNFYTWDGYDCMDYNECWKCVLKEKMWSMKNKIKKKISIKRKINAIREAWRLTRSSSVGNFIYWYKFVRRIDR